mmetsp:Transcript_37264/g.88151  ORF Transcript_37264/g.88151 Transcript_37264/m.88151 type:complete len:201 (-) Transcript_37264:8204-8806(-)
MAFHSPLHLSSHAPSTYSSGAACSSCLPPPSPALSSLCGSPCSRARCTRAERPGAPARDSEDLADSEDPDGGEEPVGGKGGSARRWKPALRVMARGLEGTTATPFSSRMSNVNMSEPSVWPEVSDGTTAVYTVCRFRLNTTGISNAPSGISTFVPSASATSAAGLEVPVNVTLVAFASDTAGPTYSRYMKAACLSADEPG